MRVVDSGRPWEVFDALREALGEGGPAVVPRVGGGDGGGGQVAVQVPVRASAPSRSRVGGGDDEVKREPSPSPLGAGGAAGSAESGLDPEPVSSGADRDGWPGPDERVPQNVALVIETSGSTGVPKRVALSADALLASAAASAGAMGGQGQWVLALPAHYVAGAQVLVRSLAAETEPLYYGEGHFDAVRFARLAGELTHDFRYTSLVPVQLARLAEAAEGGEREVAAALRRFDGILVGGQALTPRLRERAEAVGARVLSTYGSSETAGGCVYDGVPIGTTVVREVEGQLEISGPTLAEGYLGDPERTARAFHEHDGLRWYRTGDLGRVEEDGRVMVLGRADNVVISGGEKVLLDAVEQRVRTLAGYEHAVVVAVDDAEWGQVPVVVVERASDVVAGHGSDAVAERGVEAVAECGSEAVAECGAQVEPERARGVVAGQAGARAQAASASLLPPPALAEVRAHVAATLGRAAAPASVVLVARLPLVSSGKPDRIAAARLAATLRATPAHPARREA